MKIQRLKSKILFSLFFLFIGIFYSSQLKAQKHSYFFIQDQVRDGYVWAGSVLDKYEMFYLPEKDGVEEKSPTLQWRFESAGNGNYYIVDKQWNLALTGLLDGYPYKGRAYHIPLDEAKKAGKAAQWKLESIDDRDIFFRIKNAKHPDKALFAPILPTKGDANYNYLELKKYADQDNAIWRITLAAEGKEGPSEVAISEVIESPNGLVFGKAESISKSNNNRVVLNVSNKGKKDLRTGITYEHEETIETVLTSSKSYSESITAGISSTISIGATEGIEGVAELSMNASITMDYSKEQTTTESKTTEKRDSKKQRIQIAATEDIQNGSSVRFDLIAKKSKQRVPVTATGKRKYADGRIKNVKYSYSLEFDLYLDVRLVVAEN